MPLEIAQLGQPILRRKTAEVSVDDISSESFQQFIDALLATVREHQGIGLAAPQVFDSRRVFVAGVLPPPAEDMLPDMEVVINPKLTPLSEEIAVNWEGCLSFVELLVLVPRFERVRLDYINRAGDPCSLDLDGFRSRVAQHEFDHLDGILTVDRTPSPRYIIKASEVDAATAELESQSRAQRAEADDPNAYG